MNAVMEAGKGKKEGPCPVLMLIFSILNMNAAFPSETLVSISNNIRSYSAEEYLQL
jgi:hypothetical protein